MQKNYLFYTQMTCNNGLVHPCYIYKKFTQYKIKTVQGLNRYNTFRKISKYKISNNLFYCNCYFNVLNITETLSRLSRLNKLYISVTGPTFTDDCIVFLFSECAFRTALRTQKRGSY